MIQKLLLMRDEAVLDHAEKLKQFASDLKALGYKRPRNGKKSKKA